MRDFFRSRLFIFTVVVLIVSAALLILSAFREGEALPFSNAVGVVTAPVQKGLSAIGNFFSNAYGYIFSYNALKDENERLDARVSELEEQLREAAAAVEENKTLRQLLDLKEKNKSLDFEMGEIIAVTTDAAGTSYTVDRGGVHGVELYDCVVTEQGMVGYISELGTTFSHITTVIDPGMQCGAIVSRSREVAVAEGDFDLQGDGFLKLSYLKKDADVLPGDTVETSGLGGLFPKGLLIGTVERVAAEDHGISNYAVLRPAVALSDVKKVFIVKDFTVQD